MGWIQEFKEFAVKGNALDLAVGLIIGAGFGKIVSSLVDDVIMPPIGQLTGGVDFKDLAWRLGDSPEAATLNYGHFLQTVVDFAIVAFVVFLLVKGVNRLRHRHEEAPAAPAPPPEEVVLLREIRDALKK